GVGTPAIAGRRRPARHERGGHLDAGCRLDSRQGGQTPVRRTVHPHRAQNRPPVRRARLDTSSRSARGAQGIVPSVVEPAMNAREQILADIGRALASADRTPPPIPRDYRERDTAADTVDLFVERVEDYRATVRRCPETEVRQAIAAAVGSHTAIVPPDFPWAVDGSTVDIGQSAAELDRIDCIVTTARLGIASTGT